MQERGDGGLELGTSYGGDENGLDSGYIWKGEQMGVAGGLDVGRGIPQGFLVERMVPLVVRVRFARDFLSTWKSLEGQLIPFGLLGSPHEGFLYFKVNFLPSKSVCLERPFEVSLLLSQGK